MHVRPPPPCARAHASRVNSAPSIASSAETICTCRCLKKRSTAATSIARCSQLAGRRHARLRGNALRARIERTMSDVAPILHTVEAYAFDNFIGPFLRGAHVVAQRGHAKHSPSIHDHAVIIESRPRVEDAEIIAA